MPSSANADRERLKNEGQAYANDVIPTRPGQCGPPARGQAEAYRRRVVAERRG